MYEMKVTVAKADLLKKVRTNRALHRTVFADALKGYRAHCEEVLREHLRDLKEGRTPEVKILIARPEDHTREYDRLIGMLEMHQGESFELDEQTYAQYVDDDWHWKRQWLKLSSGYAPASVTANYGETEE